MKVLGVPFCSVCQETFAERIHALINPVLGYEPLVQELETTEGQDLTFSVSLLKPEPNTMKITWKKNEVVIDQNKDEITIPIGSFNTGDYSIKAEIMDTTALTRSDQHQIDHLYLIEWIVHSDHITGIEINSTELAYKIESFPNPLDEMFNLSYILPKASQVNITFQDERGRKTKSLISEKQPAGQYNYQLTPLEINARQCGIYVMILDINGTKIIRKIIKH